jgi:hypothetical protein
VSPDELERYIVTMRAHNVLVLKTPEIHLELGPAPARPLAERDPDAITLPKKSDYERLLFAATEGFSEEDE